jgi:hypothetical protein
MATSDGESCSAEDRALAEWQEQPWSDTDECDGNPWGAFERAVETTRARFVARYQEAFRAGFRAGQEHGKTCEREHADGELSKIRDRLTALETHPERLGSSEKHIDRRVEAVEKDWVQTAALVEELQTKVARLERCTVGLEPIGSNVVDVPTT